MWVPGPKARGFTLTEVLVVVGIVGLLIAILIPVISSARSRARQVACISNQRQIIMALKAYAVDHAGHFPKAPANYEGTNNRFAHPYIISPGAHSMPSSLKGYLDDSRLLICPVGEFSRDGLLQSYKSGYATLQVTSYSYFWNYSAWDNRVIPGSSTRGAFVAPRSMMDTRADDLLIADTSVLNSASPTGTYYTSHSYPGTAPDANANWKSAKRPPDDLILNAGYRDGSVRPFRFSDTHIAVIVSTTSFTIFLPPVK